MATTKLNLNLRDLIGELMEVGTSTRFVQLAFGEPGPGEVELDIEIVILAARRNGVEDVYHKAVGEYVPQNQTVH